MANQGGHAGTYLTAELMQKVEAAAKQARLSLSAWIKEAIIAKLEGK